MTIYNNAMMTLAGLSGAEEERIQAEPTLGVRFSRTASNTPADEIAVDFEEGTQASLGAGRLFTRPSVKFGPARTAHRAKVGYRVAPEQVSGIGEIDVTEEDFKVRFPATLGHKVNGIFDFLKPKPSAEEFRSRVRTLNQTYMNERERIKSLVPTQRSAALEQLNKVVPVWDLDFLLAKAAMRTDPNVIAYAAGSSSGDGAALKKLERAEAGLPVVTKLVSEMQSVNPAPTQAEETARAREATITIIDQRKQDIQRQAEGNVFTGYVLPIGGVALGLGLLTALAVSLAR